MRDWRDMNDTFPVVCLCGSTRFKDEYMEAQRRLTMEGWIVISVGLFGHADGEELHPEMKETLDEMHLRKIDMAERVHIINANLYIGESTQREIKYATFKKKSITFEFPRPEL